MHTPHFFLWSLISYKTSRALSSNSGIAIAASVVQTIIFVAPS
jgi:hypothetical protein